MSHDFAFVAEFGFEVEGVYEGAVAWRAGDRRVTVARDWRDGFTDVTFARGEVGAQTEYFSLEQALQSLGRAETWPSHGWQAYDHELAIRYVQELAALLGTVAQELLTSGSAGWVEAVTLAREQARTYTARMASRPARERADAAWHARDWPLVIEQYAKTQSAGAELSESECKRVEYARKHLAD